MRYQGPGVYPVSLTDPYADATTQPVWDAALDGRLVAQRCTHCGTFQIPPQPRCFSCRHDQFAYEELPGTGHVFSFTVARHPLGPALTEVVPYVIAVVELDGTQGAGARVIVNLMTGDPDGVAIGDRVQIVFDQVSSTYAAPRAIPISA
jgi:uncharacterized OB-fold protein